MSNGMLPSYLSMAKPNPAENRTPWYKSTAPAYAGIFLWVVFYMNIAAGTLSEAGLGLSLLALVIAALICHFLFYLVPGMYGMKTGYPLYVVGSSTYGTKGGFLMPGLLMGLLQFGWLAVNIAIATDFILQAVGKPSAVSIVDGALVFDGSAAFTVIAIIWAALAVFVAIKGIQYVGKVSTFLPIVPLLMILIVFFTNVGNAGNYTPPEGGRPIIGFLAMIGMVVGFFATAGAAGVDFGMGNRNKKDIQFGGLAGIALAIIIAGGLPLIAIAGAHGSETPPESFLFDAVIKAQGGFLATIMFALFAIASFAPACFCSFIAGNSIGTMFPKLNKTVMVVIGAIISIFLAVKGWAFNLGSVFGLIGASFGPICGSMAADYILSGCKWSGPRKGINWAGYIAWAVGFVVAILPNPMIVKRTGIEFSFITPAPVIAFVIGFVLYIILAKAGLEPPVVEMSAAAAPVESAPPETPAEEGTGEGQTE
ncbi:MAG: cytosine permease [Planctomycetota bacterium]